MSLIPPLTGQARPPAPAGHAAGNSNRQIAELGVPSRGGSAAATAKLLDRLRPGSGPGHDQA